MSLGLSVLLISVATWLGPCKMLTILWASAGKETIAENGKSGSVAVRYDGRSVSYLFPVFH